MKTNYKQFTIEQLQEKIEEINMRVIRSYSLVGESKEDPRNRKKLKREIARIKTELNSRK